MKLTGRISRRPGNRNPASAMEDANARDRSYVCRPSARPGSRRRRRRRRAPCSDGQHHDKRRFNPPTRRITNLKEIGREKRTDSRTSRDRRMKLEIIEGRNMRTYK